jgi:hypothetical protein
LPTQHLQALDEVFPTGQVAMMMKLNSNKRKFIMQKVMMLNFQLEYSGTICFIQSEVGMRLLGRHFSGFWRLTKLCRMTKNGDVKPWGLSSQTDRQSSYTRSNRLTLHCDKGKASIYGG